MWYKYGKYIILTSGILLFLGGFALLGVSYHNSNVDNEDFGVYESDCNFSYENGIYTIDAICIEENRLPILTLVEIINEVWDQISDFSGYYLPYENNFEFYGSKPIFSTPGNPYLHNSEESKALVKEAIKSGNKISFSYNELAQYYAENLSYFAADKDLTNLSNCTRQNYLIALEGMEGVILNPGDIFNANKKLASLKGYCEGRTTTDFLFYGGVCGMISQLFRVSLLEPNIVINKRFAHSEWFVQYYGEKVGGDDAAVYERSKVYEIKNEGDSDIIFKIRHKDNRSVLVAISWPTNKWISISKNTINGRETAVHLEKTVYQKENSNIDGESSTLLRTESFDSYYTKKTYDFR